MSNSENNVVLLVQQISGIFIDPGSSCLSTLLSTILNFYLFILMLISSWSEDGCHNSWEHTKCSE